MDWTKLIETRPGNLVTSAPRFFDNWYAHQQRMVARGVHVATYRIAAKRVLFEISEKPIRRGKKAIITGCLVLGCLGTLAFVNVTQPSVITPVPSQTSALAECGDLNVGLSNRKLDSIESFEIANWQIVTSTVQQSIGAVVQRNFSALCKHLLVSGTMQFSKSNLGWRILTLTRLEEPGQ